MKEKYGYDGQRPFAEEDNLSWYRGYHKGQGVPVLICEYRLSTGANEDLSSKKQEMATIANMLERVSRLEHRNIARIYDVARTESGLTIVQEDCQRGTLMSLMKTERFLDERLALFVLKQVSQGLEEMHRNNVEHGYINLENIELDAAGTWKISTRSLILKAFYLSPEYKVDLVRSKEGDVFSLGTAFYKMMYGIFPYTGKTNEQIISNIKNGVRRTESILESRLPFKIVVSRQTENLAFRMMQFQPQYRPDASGIIAEVTEILKDDQIKSRRLPSQFENSYLLFGFSDRVEAGSYANEQLLTAVHKQSNELRKVKLLTFGGQLDGGQSLDEYKKTLQRYESWQNPTFIQMKEYFEGKNILVIVYEYFNQNALAEYLDKRKELKKDEFMEDDQIQEVVSAMGQSVLAYQQNFQPHSWVTLGRVYLKNGKAKLSQPAYESEDVRKRLYTSRDQTDEVAPEKKKSRGYVIGTPAMDTWSIGAIYYHMLYGSDPTFDSSGTLIFPSTKSIKAPQMQRLSYYLSPNPKDRKSLAELDPLKEAVSQPSQINRDKTSSNIKPTESRVRRSSAQKPRTGSSYPNSQLEMRPVETASKDISEKAPSIVPIVARSPTKVSKHEELVVEEADSEDDDCFERNCLYLTGCLNMQHLDEAGFFKVLTEHWTRKVRYVLKLLVSCILYIGLFYLAFFRQCGGLLVNRNFYQAVPITTRGNATDSVPTVNFSVVTTTPAYFASYYNHTLSELKVDMDCVRDNYYYQSPYANNTYVSSYIASTPFVGFEVVGFVLVVLAIIMKGLQICRLDFSRVMNESKRTDSHKYVKMLSYVYTEMGLASLISVHYLLYGSLYHIVLTPCLKNPALPSVQKLFSGWVGTFVLLYIWQYLGLLVAYIYIIYFTCFLKRKDVPNYVWIVLAVLYIAGIGTRGMGGFVGITPYDGMVSVFGVCGELLELITMVACGLIDAIFWRALRRTKRVAEATRSQVQLFEESNATIENTEHNDLAV